MSQAKVDKYKQEKSTRKETIAKEKRKSMLTKICVGAVGIVLVGWIGISTVDAVKDSRPVKKIYCETKELDNYLNDLYYEDLD